MRQCSAIFPQVEETSSAFNCPVSRNPAFLRFDLSVSPSQIASKQARRRKRNSRHIFNFQLWVYCIRISCTSSVSFTIAAIALQHSVANIEPRLRVLTRLTSRSTSSYNESETHTQGLSFEGAALKHQISQNLALHYRHRSTSTKLPAFTFTFTTIPC